VRLGFHQIIEAILALSAEIQRHIVWIEQAVSVDGKTA